ncbi:MAG: DUF255 domain-containing protein, partial [Myxococcales bacterium]|nr:DUF255 domain-containing protein [Myxococcales bacterium]
MATSSTSAAPPPCAVTPSRRPRRATRPPSKHPEPGQGGGPVKKPRAPKLRKPNALADAASPYLRQHADNPVDWRPWGPEAFAEARRRDVPVIVSIGYSTCHWCHVM